MRQRVLVFCISYVGWLLLNFTVEWQHLTIGFFVALLVSLITWNLHSDNFRVLHHPQKYFYFVFWFLPVFLWESMKANVDVAYRVLHPSLPINPGIVKVRTTLTSDNGLTFLANSITLTPGTLVVDICKQDACMYIHCINVKGKDVESSTKIIVERFEKILVNIFS